MVEQKSKQTEPEPILFPLNLINYLTLHFEIQSPTYLVKVAFFQKVRFVFQISEKKIFQKNYPELEI